ncbi:MAG TPA: SAM-dependent methyltransferase [Legionellales bacterium]|nr:SAM-dependent methyltransferase [Legionellales bacterium]
MNELFLKKIQNKSPMSFLQYMEMALYDAEYGYYVSHPEIIGQHADFITAPELTPLFGFAIANQIKEVLGDDLESSILELGAGTGQLCLNILKHLEKIEALPKTYFILELSPVLKHKQQELIQTHLPHLYDRICWLDAWPQMPFSGVVIANEVLDAMPVRRFLWKDGQVLESYIAWDESYQKLKEDFIESSDRQLIDYVQSLELGCSVYCSEMNPWMSGWLDGLFHALKSGVVFLIDYGFPRSEYYHPDRFEGTLMCHQQHHSHGHFLSRPGMMDITAHVDFTHVAESAHDLGFQILGYTNQAAFLLSNGILEELSKEADERTYHREAQNLKLLLQSQEMGELFKVIALGKHFDKPLRGFLLQDKRVSL